MAKKYKKRKDGRYRRTITVDGTSYYVYGRTEKELNDNYIEMQIKLRKGINIKDQKILFGDYCIQWYHIYKNMKREKTKDMYAILISNHIDCLADIPISEITQVDIQECINKCYNKANTCRKLYMMLKQVFKTAIANHIVTYNPCNDIDLPKIYKSEKARDLTEEERLALFNADLDLDVKAFLFLGALCGLRRGETLALCKDDFDFVNRTVKINKSRETGKNIKARIKDMPKTNAGIREVFLIDVVYDTLKTYIDNINTHYLFTMKNGEIMSDSSYKRFWNKCKKQLNSYFDDDQITNLTSHILRHEFSTNLFYAGVDEMETQKLMGHADISTTRKIYTHLREKQLTANNKLNNFINDQLSSNSNDDEIKTSQLN